MDMPANTPPDPAVERFFQYCLAGLVASGFLALAGSGRLDPLTITVTSAALIARVLLISGVVRFHLRSSATTVLALAYMGFYAIDLEYLSRDFMTATVHLVLFLAAVKCVSANTNRDYAFLRIIAFLELLSASVISANLNFFIFLAIFLIFAIGAFAASEIRRSASRTGVVVRTADMGASTRLWSLTVGLALGILVMTCGLFFLLPRTARAALQHLVPSRYYVTGFANEVHLGGGGPIEERSTTVMHIAMADDSRPPARMKWKGGTLAQFDGHRWFNPPGVGEEFKRNRQGYFELEPSLERIRLHREKMLGYLVRVNEEAGSALFFAGDPAYLWLETPVVVRTAPGSYRPRYGIAGGFAYQASSFVPALDAPATAEFLEPVLRSTYLQLPKIDPRISLLAAQVAAGQPSDLEKSRAVEKYLREHYTYTLEQPPMPPVDPLAAFLFERRRGHCEYFASALAVMLRTLAIPSRVATGFDSGIYNPISGRQLIRASDAHSWVEAWIASRGWITLDATPPAVGASNDGLVSRLALWTDAATVFWQDWVLDYNLSQQLTLAARVEDSTQRFRFTLPDVFSGSWWNLRRAASIRLAKRYSLPASVAVLLAAFAIWVLPWLIRIARARRRVRGIRQGAVTAGDATLLYQRMLSLLHRRGIEKPAWLTPFEFAGMVQNPRLALLVDDATRAYNELRFGGRASAAQRMLGVLDRIEQFATDGHPAPNPL